MKRILVFLMLSAALAASAQQVEKLQKKVVKGDVRAMLELADYYQAGYGVPVDTAKALELYRKADALGNAEAKAKIGRLALSYSALGYDSVECFRLTKASADAGSAYGIYWQAICYLEGVAVKRDFNKGHDLLDQAIKAGSREAYTLLARGYLWGMYGYAHDIEKSYQCLKKASEGCCSNKYSFMASYYGMKGDMTSAVKWLEKGKAVGNARACLEYAIYMENGMGMSADERGALAEYRRLKEKYHGDSRYKMQEARLLASAADTSLRDPELALQLYEEMGDEPFLLNNDAIALSYIYGTFTTVDSLKAYHYFLRGVKQKCTDAMVHLAQYHNIYDRTDSARHYLLMACEYESGEAAGMLARMTYDDNPNLAIQYALQAANWGEEQYRVNAAELYAEWGDNDKAVECFDRAISNAYYDAYYGKAQFYANKLNDIRKALKLLEEGGRKGSALCYRTLGGYYESEEDYKKAVKYYELAADPQADYQIARLYLGGAIDTTNATWAKGLSMLQRSAYAGNRDGMYWLGYYYREEQNYDSALYYFNALAAQDDALALMQLGVAYEHGRGVEPDTSRAMEYYLRAGEAGYSDGYTFLADFYRNGTSTVACDSAKAFEYYMKAAAIPDDNASALYYVGDCYLRGIGVAKDTAAALPYFREAAAQGSYSSMSVLGDYYNYGWANVPFDGDTSMYYYFEASKGDDPRGDFMVGTLFFNHEEYGKGLEYIVSAAKNGSLDAYVSYAFALTYGLGLEANPDEGYAMLEALAPRNSDGRAYALMSIARMNGVGCAVDSALAFAYLDSSVACGNAEAMMRLGGYYASGDGVERDTVKTLMYYNRAVAAGSTKAMLRLAGSHMSGELAPLDKKRAAELYQMAVDRGSLEAMCRLGICYEEGEGVILNSRKAYNLYNRAAERGSAWGMRLVALCYVNGIYVKEDMEQAAGWFLKAAEAGDLHSCYVMGRLYAVGEGVKKNKKEARRWLTIAAENGHQGAAEKLAEL